MIVDTGIYENSSVLGLFLYCALLFLLHMVMERICNNNKKLNALYAIKGYRLYGLENSYQWDPCQKKFYNSKQPTSALTFYILDL